MPEKLFFLCFDKCLDLVQHYRCNSFSIIQLYYDLLAPVPDILCFLLMTIDMPHYFTYCLQNWFAEFGLLYDRDRISYPWLYKLCVTTTI